MLNRLKSFLTLATACAVLLLSFGIAGAAEIYLDPDTAYVVTSSSSEFDLQLKVDAATTGLKLFEYAVRFYPDMLDTVSITQGPLMPSAGQPTSFGYYLLLEDTVLKVEDLVLGAGVTVDGPGVLADIRLTATAPGKAELYVIKSEMRDVTNTIFPSTSGGLVVYVDYPPTEFNLLSPSDGADVHRYPMDSIRLAWNKSASVYPGEGVTYRLQYGTSPTFDVGSTTTLTGLTDTTKWLYADDLSGGTYYWRVYAVGNVNSFERLCAEESASFDFTPDNPISAFSLVYPAEGQTVSGMPGEMVTFSWRSAMSAYPGEWVQYKFELSKSSTFSGTVLTRMRSDTTYSEPVDNFDQSAYYWRVTAIGGTYSFERESAPFPGSFDFQLGMVEPSEFDLISPADAELVETSLISTLTFDWEDSPSSVGDDTLMYTFYLGPDPGFPGSAVVTDSSQDLSLLEGYSKCF